MKKQAIIAAIVAFLIGILLGGFLFSDTQPRSILAITQCEDCLSTNELTGLVGSILVQRAPGLIPGKVLETDYTLVIDHPFPDYDTHLVFIPKKDIKDIGNLSAEDEVYINDLIATASTIITQNNYENYIFWSNGPGRQGVNYLHFHLGAE
jgi:hypothetical protein